MGEIGRRFFYGHYEKYVAITTIEANWCDGQPLLFQFKDP